MFVNKGIDTMLDEIGFKELGVYDFVDGEPLLPGIFLCSMNLVSEHPFLGKYECLINEMMGNGAFWGNNGDAYLALTVKVFVGEKGWIVRIRDSGTGFSVNDVVHNGIYQGGGKGLALLRNLSELEFNYEDQGSTLNIQGKYI